MQILLTQAEYDDLLQGSWAADNNDFQLKEIDDLKADNAKARATIKGTRAIFHQYLHKTKEVRLLCLKLEAENAALKKHRGEILAMVSEQAENESLWFKSVYVTETILQGELRRLHAALEVRR